MLEELAYRDTWGKGTDSFIAMIYERLRLMHDLLADDGSIYVHCDYQVNSYIRLALDEVFGKDNFRNEIIWKYFRLTSTDKNFPKKHDDIFFYTKANNYYFNGKATLVEYDEKAIKRYDKQDQYGNRYKIYREKNGTERKAYLKRGKPTEVFLIPFVQGTSIERLDYPTQKPKALLERIIKASSNEGRVFQIPCHYKV